jgi:hypothetical protein
MSERRFLSLILAGAVIALPVQGQDLAQLKRREAELIARRDQLFAQSARESQERFASGQRAYLTVGRFTVAYPKWVAEEGDAHLAATVSAQVERYGTAADSLLTDTLYVWVVEVIEGRMAGVKYRLGAIEGARRVWVDSTTRVASVEEIVNAPLVEEIATAVLLQWAKELLDTSLTSWVGSLDQRNTVVAVRDPIVRDLVASRSTRARRCLAGAVIECRLLLEVDDGSLPLLDAYDAADLPGLFEAMDLSDRIPGRANCVGKRDPAACADLVRSGRVRPPHPVSMRTRQSLFTYAIASGGDGAWLRLHRARGLPVGEQLSFAARQPVDSLLVSWHRDLLAGRRTTTAGVVPSLMLAVVWGLLGIILFAWRYRWRHV